jgi:hypothetical protein
MALVALCLWVVLAWVLMVSLTSKQSWPAAYCLIAGGLPLLAWLWVEQGPLFVVVGAAVMATVLRWPMIYLGRWLRSLPGRFRAL